MNLTYCSGCKNAKPTSAFGVNEATKSGLDYQCLQCRAEKSRQRRKDNPEGHRRAAKRWRKRNTDALSLKAHAENLIRRERSKVGIGYKKDADRAIKELGYE